MNQRDMPKPSTNKFAPKNNNQSTNRWNQCWFTNIANQIKIILGQTLSVAWYNQLRRGTRHKFLRSVPKAQLWRWSNNWTGLLKTTNLSGTSHMKIVKATQPWRWLDETMETIEYQQCVREAVIRDQSEIGTNE